MTPTPALSGVIAEANNWLAADCAELIPIVLDTTHPATTTWVIPRHARQQFVAFANPGELPVVASIRETLTGSIGEWQRCESCASCLDLDVSAGIRLAPGTTTLLKFVTDAAPPTRPPHVLHRMMEWTFER